MKKSLKQQLTEEVVVILQKYEGKRFGETYQLIKKDVEDFLVSKGVQRSLLPEVWVSVDEYGYVNVECGPYPEPTPLNLN